VKIGAGGFYVRRCQSREKISQITLNALACAEAGSKTPYRIAMKFCAGVGVLDIITHAKFSLWVLGTAEGQISQFSIDFRRRHRTLSHVH